MVRPRKPLNLLKATGAYRPDRHADRENAPQADGQPEMPHWLDEEARSCWQTTVPQLVAMGVASNVDSLALAGMCRWSSVWRKADAGCRRVRVTPTSRPLRPPQGGRTTARWLPSSG